MQKTFSIRRADPGDLSSVDRLLGRSYPKLLAPDYPPSILVLVVPIICRAQPDLLASGRYFLAVDTAGQVLAAGGWSFGKPRGLAGEARDTCHVRHVATDPDITRRRIGRRLMTHVMQDARQGGVRWLDCLSTRTAVPFYAALGFRALYPTEVPLGPGISFPAVRMLADLAPE